MYKVINDDYSLISEHETLADAEVALCRELNLGTDAYLQYPEDA